MEYIYICLDNLRSLFNIGAVMRTCSFFGISDLVLLGYSGKSKNVYGKTELNPRLSKTALSADKDMNLIFLDTTKELLDFAREKKLKVVCFEQNPKSIKLNKWKPQDSTLLVFGNEVTGVSKEILENCCQIVEIDRRGNHNSLNVEVTAGIAIAHLFNS
jgi:23S rRNA (guanosine2251-2'-O)-methyltransferase